MEPPPGARRSQAESAPPSESGRYIRKPVAIGVRARFHETPWHHRYVIAQGTCHPQRDGEYGCNNHELGDVLDSPCWAIESIPPTWGQFHGTSGYFITAEGNDLPQPEWFTQAFSDDHPTDRAGPGRT